MGGVMIDGIWRKDGTLPGERRFGDNDNHRPAQRFQNMAYDTGGMTEYNRVSKTGWRVRHNGGIGDRYLFRLEDQDGNVIDESDDWNALATRACKGA